jgi:hypothetical protein
MDDHYAQKQKWGNSVFPVCANIVICEFQANNPSNWLVPLDLFTSCYARLSQDFDEPMDVDGFFSFGQIIGT